MKYSLTNFRQKDKSEIKSQNIGDSKLISQSQLRVLPLKIDLDLNMATRGVLRTHIYNHGKVLLFELKFFQDLALDWSFKWINFSELIKNYKLLRNEP